MPKNTKNAVKPSKKKEKTTFTPKEKNFTCYGRKQFFTAKEREQLFTLYKRLLHLSGDTLQKTTVASSKRILSRQLPKVVCHEITLE